MFILYSGGSETARSSPRPVSITSAFSSPSTHSSPRRPSAACGCYCASPTTGRTTVRRGKQRRPVSHFEQLFCFVSSLFLASVFWVAAPFFQSAAPSHAVLRASPPCLTDERLIAKRHRTSPPRPRQLLRSKSRRRHRVRQVGSRRWRGRAAGPPRGFLHLPPVPRVVQGARHTRPIPGQHHHADAVQGRTRHIRVGTHQRCAREPMGGAKKRRCEGDASEGAQLSLSACHVALSFLSCRPPHPPPAPHTLHPAPFIRYHKCLPSPPLPLSILQAPTHPPFPPPPPPFLQSRVT